MSPIIGYLKKATRAIASALYGDIRAFVLAQRKHSVSAVRTVRGLRDKARY